MKKRYMNGLRTQIDGNAISSNKDDEEEQTDITLNTWNAQQLKNPLGIYDGSASNTHRGISRS